MRSLGRLKSCRKIVIWATPWDEGEGNTSRRISHARAPRKNISRYSIEYWPHPELLRVNRVEGQRSSHAHGCLKRPGRQNFPTTDWNKQDVVRLQGHVGSLRFQHLLNPDLGFHHAPVGALAKNPRVAELGGLVRSARQGERLQHSHRPVVS